MSLKVAVVPDQIRKDGSQYAKVVRQGTIKFDRLLEFMQKGIATEPQEIVNVLTSFAAGIAHYLSEGQEVKTPIGTFAIGIAHALEISVQNGVAGDTAETIRRDGLHVHLRPDTDLQNEIRTKIDITTVRRQSPLLPAVSSIRNTEVDDAVNSASANQVIHLRGKSLSFLKHDEELGVFFVSQNGDGVHRSTVYTHIGSSIVDCKVPELPQGLYTVEVRTRPTSTVVRSGAYPQTFTVV